MSALLENYSRAPLTIVRGEGCYLYDEGGASYLDFIGGIAVCALGHAHPAITDAVARQAATLVHASNLFHHEPAGTLARELTARSGLDRVFFCNSGAEANEAAIKLARKRAFRRGEAHRTTILACTGSFHGRTLGALAATANPAYKEGFAPLPAGFAFTPFNDVDALEDAIDETVAAFIVEPVQGESGVHPASRAFLARALELCERHGALLVFDEIQCGAGRLGPLFAFQHAGVRPHVVTMAKALANGLPIGAMLVADVASSALQPGDHGSTFGGSPIPAAAALAHLRVRDELQLERAVAVASERLFTGLHRVAEQYSAYVGTPRGVGLLVGLPLDDQLNAAAIIAAVRERGVLLGTAGGNTLRFAPPLIVEGAQIDRAIATLKGALDAEVKRLES